MVHYPSSSARCRAKNGAHNAHRKAMVGSPRRRGPMFAAKPPLFRSVFEFANRFPNPSTPRRRRFAPEAWDDTEVIPPLFGSAGANRPYPDGTIHAPNAHIAAATPIDPLEGDAPSAPTRAAEPTPPDLLKVGRTRARKAKQRITTR